ncbi:pyridoxamine 5'-phosphate oxidase family protein [Deinococcus pimensis]|uniref:pyridoxamine 5'-phosphate oxidase family protein n=1 Tax=Deinococcus pimensis TaxID=309888 RepID=UPI00048A3976|nr:pyridoxamine 5'-phosphate oxidase family protein [Deinococcus pimensis]
MSNDAFTVTTLEELSRLYPAPSDRATRKQLDHLDAHGQAFIAASSFLIISTFSDVGADCSPRGDHPGFVQVLDERTLLLPDRRGNNRLDSLRNIVCQPEVGLLFLVPGVNETLRVNGAARISTDPALLERCRVQGQLPVTVLIIQVREAFVQCPRALVRSQLWDPSRHLPRGQLPSLGRMLADHTGGLVNAEEYDTEHEERLHRTLY